MFFCFYEYKFEIFSVYKINTINVTSMASMFFNCLSLTTLNLSNFNTINVTNMASMFNYCLNLQITINILNANTAYNNMFTNYLTDGSSNVTIGYKTETKFIAEAMKETAGSNQSKITLKQI